MICEKRINTISRKHSPSKIETTKRLVTEAQDAINAYYQKVGQTSHVVSIKTWDNEDKKQNHTI